MKLSDFIINNRTCSVLGDKIGQLFIWVNRFCLCRGLQYHSDCLQMGDNINFSCYLMS